ncbi:MAG TPA: potassium transporter Kup [Caulobacteraceae bacterium]|jgi:KUP system potassium uptake protein
MAGSIPGAEAASPSLAPPAEPASPPSPFVPSAPTAPGHGSKKASTLALSVGALGVVFGDIGTSPLYAFHDALNQAAERGGVSRDDVLGVLSLALWALLLVVTVKYVLFLMRADNNGEGGVLSLMALTQRALGRRTMLIFVLGVLGAALFYGDSIITPAISVLSAVEGLKTIHNFAHMDLGHLVTTRVTMIVSVVILLGLFMVQSRGTQKVANYFGPIMCVWFITIGGLGAWHMALHPGVFAALNPWFGIRFLAAHGFIAFLVLGAVFLTVTGAEALYADMGHFGRWPIQFAWLFFALPCLMLNYFGQGAMAIQAVDSARLHHHGIGDVNWFFVMAPEVVRPYFVVFAGVATVIASQAVITGAFSLTQQAVQLGLLPRIDIKRTSETLAGQIFVPQINTMLTLGVLAVVILFRTSDALSNAYGLAVTGTMVVTTSLAFIVERRLWKWSLLASTAFVLPFITLDVTFLASNVLKIAHGGWFPLGVAVSLFMVMWIWTKGAQILTDKTRRDSIPITDLSEMLRIRPPNRAPGTAIFLTSDPDVAPVALMHNLKHNKVLHEKNVLLTVKTLDQPRVAENERVTMETINADFRKITIAYGFMETPNVPKALGVCRKQGLKFDIMSTSFFLGRRSVVPSAQSGMPLWQDKLFIFLMKNAANPTDFFHIPPGRVVELGAQVTV